MMFSNLGNGAPYDNNYSNVNANHSLSVSSGEYQAEVRGAQAQQWQNDKYSENNHASRNYSNTSAEVSSASTAAENTASRSSVTHEKKGTTETVAENSNKTSSTDTSTNTSSLPEYTGKENSTGKRRNDTTEYGHSSNGNTYEGGVDTGARSKGPGRGRGGRGWRGGRRGYYNNNQGYSDFSNSGGSNNNTRFERQEDNVDERKRDRNNALTETAAFLKNINTRKADGNSTQEQGNDRRNRNGRGRYDQGSGRGTGYRYQQREYQGEDKQGKEWANRQARVEKEKDFCDMQNTYTKQNRTQNRELRYERGYSHEQGRWKNQSRYVSRTFEASDHTKESSVNGVENKNNVSLVTGPRSNRGRGRGRQDRKLWDNSASLASNHTSAPVNRRASDVTSQEVESIEVKETETSNRKGPQGTEDEETQRDRLTEQLTKGSYECMVCCDRIKQQHAIWSCLSCHNCFHLGCIKKWAKSSTGEGGWRCPACQGPTPKVPNAYMCFCGKVREPEWNRRDMAHSCGEVCGRRRKIEWCNHKCNILCHPGPCPPCTAYIKRSCACGAVSRDVKCSQTEPFLCGGVCGKLLNCEGHKCEKTCHTEPCGNCLHKIQQSCFCGKTSREVDCIPDTREVTTYGCGDKCSQVLNCGQHQCEEECHPGKCQPCQKAVEIITRCPCGKVPLEKLYERDGAIQRKKCSDPVPTCSQPCQRQLKCGVPGAFHQCQALCHEGPCPSCPLETSVKCRCGAMDCNIPCSELTTKADEVTCKKQCKKLRHCGRHKCNTRCCIDVDHICSLVCGKMLSCGLHKCEEPCHRGNCPRCWQTSFDELTCHCGASVLYPPVPCGTKPPACENPCHRPQTCSHPATHNCHPEEPCPPCTMLVDKPCFGGHKMMRRTLCYLTAVSCGSVCGKLLPCGLHNCQRVCHEQPCVSEESVCPQKCLKPRESCGHPCANPCHAGPCPDNSCKEMVKITCECGLRKATLQCSENDREYRTLATSMLASQMQSLNDGCSVDLSEIFTATARPDKLKRLPCNEDCQTEERNRRLALALQIENPEAREKLGSSSLYSDFMKEEARKDPNLAKTVHDALTELVLRAKESKQKSVIHSFPSMNREKRHFIHEYCEHFGCKSESYDEEPNKNVVATAVRGMCFLPPLSVLAHIKREQGQRKVPAPVWSRKSPVTESSQGMQKLEKTRAVKKETTPTTPTATKSPPIDYFDFED
ncbi:hypothetical protein Pcinc_016866 [Petrolisthes cinctipes]|uniref:Shuttle craft n=1 Tax=Petrolisthes cinctipes TaxID=88211 RepID=A0AAE1FVC8_PETCI|nr:hypothetical protein Pcinc_016866 [Petrolisthes cinctipes]